MQAGTVSALKSVLLRWRRKALLEGILGEKFQERESLKKVLITQSLPCYWL